MIENPSPAVKKVRKPTFDLNYVQDVSERVYRIRLNQDCGKDTVEKMIAKDADGGKKLRSRSDSYDKLTRAYLEVLGFEPEGDLPTLKPID